MDKLPYIYGYGTKEFKANCNTSRVVEIIIHDAVTKLITARVKNHKKTVDILDDIRGKILFRI